MAAGEFYAKWLTSLSEKEEAIKRNKCEATMQWRRRLRVMDLAPANPEGVLSVREDEGDE